MSTHPGPKLSRQAADRLLAAKYASRDSDSRTAAGSEGTVSVSLACLLAAAAAPSTERDLSGETNAVAAFRVAHLVPATRPRWRQSMSAPKLLAAKALLAAVGVTASGGVALAAATGHMPVKLGGQSAASPSDTATETPTPGTYAKHHITSPLPNMKGLCTAYTKGVADSSGKALDNPSFRALIAAAGEKSKVAAFCMALPPNAKLVHIPTEHPTGKPTGLPIPHKTPKHPMPSMPAHPGGAPNGMPSGMPNSAPSGMPSGHSHP